MNVEDVMTPREDVVTVEIPGTRDDVLEYLQDRKFSSVPAVKQTDGEEIYRGIITRSVLIDRPNEDQLALLAEEVSTTTTGTTVTEVAKLMWERGERRIPVVDGDQLKGILTLTDIVRAIARGEAGESITAEDVAGEEVNCVYSETPLPVAERELAFAQVPYAVVLDEHGDLTGMLTEVDIIDVARVVEGEEDTGESIANQDDEWAWEGIKAVGNRYMPTRNVEIPAEPVSEFMTADLLTVSKQRPITEVAQLLIEHDIEQLPLVSGGNLSGIVQDIDLLEAFA
ncbi:CBS domain-containing protein [Halobacteriaceae archaeon SHR40]|uniref:CBS domain-containing protein n=1 Tax=Halovenus amylolytica TaxID=2500550 RepID=UPI000FE2BB9E